LACSKAARLSITASPEESASRVIPGEFLEETQFPDNQKVLLINFDGLRLIIEPWDLRLVAD
jgi:hypothetical protein